MDDFEEYKESLIDLIIWYRDYYHKDEFGHNELIEQVKNSKNEKDLNIIELTLDNWFDNLGPEDF